MHGSLNSQRVMCETWPRRNVGRHFTFEFQLPIGPFHQQHDHQVFKRDDANPQLHQLDIRQSRGRAQVDIKCVLQRPVWPCAAFVVPSGKCFQSYLGSARRIFMNIFRNYTN